MVKSTVFSTSTKQLAVAAQQTDFEELDLQLPIPLTANVELNVKNNIEISDNKE